MKKFESIAPKFKPQRFDNEHKDKYFFIGTLVVVVLILAFGAWLII
jgi:hypothetical protein